MTLNLVTLGIDIADRYSSYCVVDPAGDVVEEGRLQTTEKALSNRFKDFRTCGRRGRYSFILDQ